MRLNVTLHRGKKYGLTFQVKHVTCDFHHQVFAKHGGTEEVEDGISLFHLLCKSEVESCPTSHGARAGLSLDRNVACWFSERYSLTGLTWISSTAVLHYHREAAEPSWFTNCYSLTRFLLQWCCTNAFFYGC